MPETTWSLPATIEQTAGVDDVNETRPVPLPPVVTIVASGAPYVALVGPVIERTSWAALLTATA